MLGPNISRLQGSRPQPSELQPPASAMAVKRPAASDSAKTPASAMAMKRPAASDSAKRASKKPAKTPSSATAETAAEKTPEKPVKFRRLEAKESLSVEPERPVEKTPENWQGLLRLRKDFSPGLRADFSPAASDATTKVLGCYSPM